MQNQDFGERKGAPIPLERTYSSAKNEFFETFFGLLFAMDPDQRTYLNLDPFRILNTSFKTSLSYEKLNVSDKKINNKFKEG